MTDEEEADDKEERAREREAADDKRESAPAEPPGLFVSPAHLSDTRRFLDEVKKLIRRRNGPERR
jgi:hypothetical protein